ncbi:MAG: DUF1698 domain-containing protein [Chloroflexota bacterium]
MSILSKPLQLIKNKLNRTEHIQPYPWTQEPPTQQDPESLKTQIDSYHYWYQRIYLGQNIYTIDGPAAYHEYVWSVVSNALPSYLDGASVLDIGTNAGYFSIQAKFRGAGRVVGVESIDDYFRQAELCRSVWDLDIDYQLLDAHDVNKIDEIFDIVIFTGILYHLKNPLQVLEEIGERCKDTIILETEVVPDDRRNRIFVRQGAYGKQETTPTSKGFMKFIERDELNGDGSNWWVPDTECVMGMLRTAGFQAFTKPIYSGEGRLILVASKSPNTICDLSAFDDLVWQT